MKNLISSQVLTSYLPRHPLILVNFVTGLLTNQSTPEDLASSGGDPQPMVSLTGPRASLLLLDKRQQIQKKPLQLQHDFKMSLTAPG
jgi:hypothetical protein